MASLTIEPQLHPAVASLLMRGRVAGLYLDLKPLVSAICESVTSPPTLFNDSRTEVTVVEATRMM